MYIGSEKRTTKYIIMKKYEKKTKSRPKQESIEWSQQELKDEEKSATKT